MSGQKTVLERTRKTNRNGRASHRSSEKEAVINKGGLAGLPGFFYPLFPFYRPIPPHSLPVIKNPPRNTPFYALTGWRNRAKMAKPDIQETP